MIAGRRTEIAGHREPKPQPAADQPCRPAAKAVGRESNSRARLVEKPTWTTTTEPWPLRGQRPPQDGRGLRGLGPVAELVGITRLPVIFGANQFPEVVAVVRRHAAPHHADRDVAVAVESVHDVNEGRGVAVVLAEGDRDQAAAATALVEVDHPQGQGVVNVVAHVGVEDQWHWPTRRHPGWDAAGQNREHNWHARQTKSSNHETTPRGLSNQVGPIKHPINNPKPESRQGNRRVGLTSLRAPAHHVRDCTKV